ncbi:MAG: acylphosphatase [Acidobacteria bacterium]|nr:acylphosphatase [Acidobacteriota bacterium]NIO60817.1 acylphosphatase [Acidobacteriota bacterium]NIQ31889.1 acylphosphatase [Acidobacteriota bacterium]NIQ87269.1 acylphosphatase [Acidobacteriota bacterium]NIT12485.1 acylphosphatase [Acidobacteriota bacterium]
MRKKESTREPRWIRLRVHGLVQGVGYRRFVQRAAGESSLVGDVRNLEDGSVEIRTRGTSEELKRLISEVSRGPAGARVDDFECLDPEPSDALTRFEIL